MSSQADKALRPTAVPAGRWTVGGPASTARFAIRDKLIHTVRGSLPVTGGDAVTDAAGQVVSARVELDAAGIMTGNARRDRDVQGRRFLDAESHPRIVVEAETTTTSGGGWAVRARLSARGATCPVDLEVTPMTIEGERVRMHVTGHLDRTGLGMRVPTFVIGRDVELDVDLDFTRL
ncbi:YceI family protein [Humibacillus xanthopallidus]|uniref:Polyisoprenoid-binding protein YceI n=1 Tax=Humibacillus xanthopallidus TaxID=412689 RepID=A0A543H870_9MICO|nr:YceI family protein [Humibacillus xanthopallidus]TQM54544.1 polyisoprenoid-binding protein YceI [Humibacillus xanthopallidus]